MSQRRVGPGRLPVDEGPASAAVSDPMAEYGRLSAAGIPDPLGFGREIVPTGGAGPIERRTATPEEMAAAWARDVAPSPIAPRHPRHPWKTPKPSPAAVPSQDQAVEKPVEKPVHIVSTEVPTEPVDTPDVALRVLADAAMTAATAWVARETAALAWEQATAALEAAHAAVSLPHTPQPVVNVWTNAGDTPHEIIEKSGWKPTAEGGRATREQLQQSRRNGHAAQQAQRRAVELTSAAAAKATVVKRSPEAREHMRVAMLASYARRKAATS